jgi:hypothetical protein
MKFGLHHVAQMLESGVHDLGHPGQRDRQHDPAPFRRRQPKHNARYDHRHRRAQMDPGVVLALQHEAESAQRIAEASHPVRDAEHMTLPLDRSIWRAPAVMRNSTG